MSDVFHALGSGPGERVPSHGRAFPRRLIDRPSQRTHFRYHYVTPVLFTIRLRGRSPCFTIVGRKQIAGRPTLFTLRLLVIFTVRGQRKFSTEPFRDEKTLHSAAVISSDEEVYPRRIRSSAEILGDSTRQHLNSSFPRNKRLWDKRGSLSITRETFRNFSFKGLPSLADDPPSSLVGSQNSSKEISSLNEFPRSVTGRDIAHLGHWSSRPRVSFLRGVSPEAAPSSRRVLPVLRCDRSGILVGSTFRALPTDRKCTTGLSRTTVTGRAAFQPHHPSASFATITRVVRYRFAHHPAPPSLLGTPRRHVVIPHRRCSLLVRILSSPSAPPHRGIFARERAAIKLSLAPRRVN